MGRAAVAKITPAQRLPGFQFCSYFHSFCFYFMAWSRAPSLSFPDYEFIFISWMCATY